MKSIDFRLRQDGNNAMFEFIEKSDNELVLGRYINTETYKEKTEISLDTSNKEALRRTAEFLVNNAQLTQTQVAHFIGRSQSWVSQNIKS